MAQRTAIGWTDLSWNPVHGCSIVSTECKHCYAAELSLRHGQTAKPWTPANAAENVTLKPHKMREPLSNAKAWRGLGDAARAAGKTDGMLVFVNSMSDLFHELVPFGFVDEVFTIMALADRHTFQILTKRPDRMREYVLSRDGLRDLPLPNVWLGVSVGLRQFVRRADVLRETPAAVRFVSAEPLLGPLLDMRPCSHRDYCYGNPDADECACACEGGDGRIIYGGIDMEGLDWLIIGGESGPGHRPMMVDWARDLAGVARQVGTAVFVKQLGGARPGTAFEDLPEDLRSRDFPVPAGVRR